jgi:predicted amino acid-binding ACT domain protein
MNAMTTAGNLTKGILVAFCISFLFLVIEFLIIEQTVLAGFMIVGFMVSISITLYGYAKDKRSKKS